MAIVGTITKTNILIFHFYAPLITSENQSKRKIRAEGGEFHRVLLGVRIKVPIGKTYKCHISAISNEECTAKNKCKFFHKLLREPSTKLMKFLMKDFIFSEVLKLYEK